MWLGVFICVVIASLLAFLVWKKISKRIEEKYIAFVTENSEAIANLVAMNQKFRFNKATCFDCDHTYDNYNFYETISCEDYLIYFLQFKQWEIQKEIKLLEANKKEFERYQSEIEGIKVFGKYRANFEKYKKEKLLNAEKKIFLKTCLHPVTDFTIQIDLCYSTMDGRICAGKSETFLTDDVLSFIKRLNNKNGFFYNDKEIWNAICRVERGKVSNKMRFSIHQRDGNRCKICGARGGLEIDHIKPIAKGGKSTYDNLQTLCKRCNKEKGDNYVAPSHF